MYTELQLLLHTPNCKPLTLWQQQRYLNPTPIITSVAFSKAKKANRQADLTVNCVDTNLLVSEKSLQKIVDEVLDNAFKFSEPGTPIQIRTQITAHHWMLNVRDQGRGMTAEQIAHIGAYMQFERQYYEQQGVGLGLTLVRLLTHLNQGEFAIESTPHQETTVIVMFPQTARLGESASCG
ncbi:hypothetical protein GF339_19185 [candidate division KSB3 bacterium]|uniref:histidine kinase n=1 Tax=candidate division KSB3 bacterium TaxID=2044937 RepID=A0A9D5Q8B1_9BACT|nr:hypothetical protein [candidate division KSB3 bacterium]MBD3326716.1 hypothetical protein [candidate division KSB3 bacterium]